MAKGKKYNDDIREKAFALLACNNNVAYIAEKLNLPQSTIRSWRNEFNSAPKNEEAVNFVELRAKFREKFVADAWEIINKCSRLMQRNLDKALSDEEAPEPDLAKLSTVLGTVYDKQALSNREATEIVGGDADAPLRIDIKIVD